MMSEEVFKTLVPVFLIFYWLYFVVHAKNLKLAGVTLFFTSVAAFSQNFYFFFRELHQAIQVVLLVFAVVYRVGIVGRFNFVFFGLILFVCASLIWNPIDEDAMVQLLNLFVVIGVTNYLFMCLRCDGDFDVVLKFIGVFAIIISVFGIFEYVLGVNSRVEVTFANPNYLGFYLGIGFICVHQKLRFRFRGIGLVLIICCILLTGSRSALVLPLFVVLWANFRLHGFVHLLKYIVLVALLFFGVLMSGATRLSDYEEGKSSDAERLIFSRIAKDMADDYPLTGVGWGRFVAEFSNYAYYSDAVILAGGDIDATNQERRVTHNDLLRVLAELGYFAFFSVLLLFIIGLRNVLLLKDLNSIYILPIWLGCIFFSLTHNNLNTAFFWFFFLLPFVNRVSHSNKTT